MLAEGDIFGREKRRNSGRFSSFFAVELHRFKSSFPSPDSKNRLRPNRNPFRLPPPPPADARLARQKSQFGANTAPSTIPNFDRCCIGSELARYWRRWILLKTAGAILALYWLSECRRIYLALSELASRLALSLHSRHQRSTSIVRACADGLTPCPSRR